MSWPWSATVKVHKRRSNWKSIIKINKHRNIRLETHLFRVFMIARENSTATGKLSKPQISNDTLSKTTIKIGDNHKNWTNTELTRLPTSFLLLDTAKAIGNMSIIHINQANCRVLWPDKGIGQVCRNSNHWMIETHSYSNCWFRKSIATYIQITVKKPRR